MLIKVLIVARTRQGSGACIGGITSDGRSVRLVAANAETNEHAGLEYAVGEVWEVEATPAARVVPPHVENIIVSTKRKLGKVADPVSVIERHMSPVVGDITALYDGLAQATEHGSLYIAERSGIPVCSTMFWRPPQPLQRSDDGKRIRYCYPAPDGTRSLVFVGFQEPVEVIPAGALLRVSLAHWWRPQDSDCEQRCYVQLSGWFISPAVMATDEPQPARAFLCPSPEDTLAQPVSPPTSAGALGLLKSVFGYDAFRPLQAEIIANLLKRQDTLAIMPTGSGKSL
jgi:ATP-dependent DNA helicase RecQ